jgi:hypothetical protein
MINCESCLNWVIGKFLRNFGNKFEHLVDLCCFHSFCMLTRVVYV